MAGLGPALSGCAELAYYRQAAAGQWELLRARRPVADLLADPEKYRDQVIVARPLEVVETPAALPFFRVADAGRPEPQLVVIGFKGAVPAVGARISVRGKFTFYEKKGYWELQVRDWDQGAVIVLPDGASE